MVLRFTVLLVSLAACGDPHTFLDADKDGHAWPEDCDDDDDAIYPDAPEQLNGKDDDCDGLDDDGLDDDGDGYFTDAVSGGTDCDDDNADVNPGEPLDICDNGLDDDCDGATDWAWPAVVLQEYLLENLPLPALCVAPVLETGEDNDRLGTDLALLDGFGLVAGAPGRASAAGGVQIVQVRREDSEGDDGEPVYTVLKQGQALTSADVDTRAGGSVSVGDLDADGASDLLVGAPGSGGGGGDAWLVDGYARYFAGGASSNTAHDLDAAENLDLFLEEDDATFGGTVALVPSLDGDATSDLLVRAARLVEGSQDAVWLVFGDPDLFGKSTLPVELGGAFEPVKLTSDEPDDDLGAAIAGFPDLISGAGSGTSGANGALLGAPSATGCQPEDGDGVARGVAWLIAAVDRDSTASGVVELAEDATLCVQGEEGDRLGGALAGGTDLDGDGYGDLLVGAPTASLGMAWRTGAALLYLGPFGDSAAGPQVLTEDDATARFGGSADEQGVGASVAFGGDVDGDGAADLLIGSDAQDLLGYDDAGSGARPGRAWLVWGSDALGGTVNLDVATAPLVRLEGDTPGAWRVSGGADLDGDGLDEVLLGLPDAGSGQGAVALLWGQSY